MAIPPPALCLVALRLKCECMECQMFQVGNASNKSASNINLGELKISFPRLNYLTPKECPQFLTPRFVFNVPRFVFSTLDLFPLPPDLYSAPAKKHPPLLKCLALNGFSLLSMLHYGVSTRSLHFFYITASKTNFFAQSCIWYNRIINKILQRDISLANKLFSTKL